MIELLVVVGILGVLTALALPGLAGAKRAARLCKLLGQSGLCEFRQREKRPQDFSTRVLTRERERERQNPGRL